MTHESGVRLQAEEVEAAVTRAMKRVKTDSDAESVSLSDVGKTEWGYMSRSRQLILKPTDLQPGEILSSDSTSPKFSWTDAYEGSQSDRFVGGFCLKTQIENDLLFFVQIYASSEELVYIRESQDIIVDVARGRK